MDSSSGDGLWIVDRGEDEGRYGDTDLSLWKLATVRIGEGRVVWRALRRQNRGNFVCGGFRFMLHADGPNSDPAGGLSSVRTSAPRWASLESL